MCVHPPCRVNSESKGAYAYLVLSDKETEVQRCEEALLRLHSWPVEKVKHQGFGF